MLFKSHLSFVFILTTLLFSNVSLSEEINFSDEAVAKELLLDRYWVCIVKDKWGEGETTLKFKKVNGAKVKGAIHMFYCPSQEGSFNGKLEKNKLKFGTTQPRPCGNRSGILEFVREEGKSVTAKGTYRLTSGDPGTKGTISCNHN